MHGTLNALFLCFGRINRGLDCAAECFCVDQARRQEAARQRCSSHRLPFPCGQNIQRELRNLNPTRLSLVLAPSWTVLWMNACRIRAKPFFHMMSRHSSSSGSHPRVRIRNAISILITSSRLLCDRGISHAAVSRLTTTLTWSHCWRNIMYSELLDPPLNGPAFRSMHKELRTRFDTNQAKGRYVNFIFQQGTPSAVHFRSSRCVSFSLGINRLGRDHFGHDP